MKNNRLRSLTRNAFAIGLIVALAVTGFTACNRSPKEIIPEASTKISEDAVDTKTAVTEITEAKSVPGLGGWKFSSDYKVTEDLNKVFQKAMSKIVGADYTPLAYLGSQIVSGTNHCFLCKEQIVYPGAAPRYALVYIHEDMDKDGGLCRIDGELLADLLGIDVEGVSALDDLTVGSQHTCFFDQLVVLSLYIALGNAANVERSQDLCTFVDGHVGILSRL